MHYAPNPAAQVASSLSGPMSFLAGGVVSGVMALGNSLGAHREQREVHAYANALARAKAHAADMEAVAREALIQLSRLGAENAALRRACVERQDHIKFLTRKERARAA